MTDPAAPPATRPAAIRPRSVSPITRRILAVNVLALAILVAGLLYLDEYRRGLIQGELAALRTQAEIFAVALAEGAVSGRPEAQKLLIETADQMVRRMVETTGIRTRLFGVDGTLFADSRLLVARGVVEADPLPPPDAPRSLLTRTLDLYDGLVLGLTGRSDYPPYREAPVQTVADYDEAVFALNGDTSWAVRRLAGQALLLTVAVPVQRYKRVLGVVMLSRDSREMDAALLDVRRAILGVFGVALAVTVLLSVYLAGTIARPIRRLAQAADRVRRGKHRQYIIPDFDGRDDEIGDLAIALRDMTEALWQRMDATERFAADVAHEIKNPLSSLRSAIETAARVDDPERQRKLMAIVIEDVHRLDRLISDISDASRLDAELSKGETGPVDLSRMLETLVDIHQAAAGGPRLRVDDGDGGLRVDGLEGRLVQVFRNLIANAVSFSPPDGVITLRLTRDGDAVVVTVEDDGPGIPPGREDAIFERFYSERPAGEKFGTHSGLGLSISRQIVEAHGGRLTADNRPGGGTRFTVRLPVAE